MEAEAYIPPVLPALRRRLLDALAGRETGFGLEVAGRTWRIEPLARMAESAPAPVLAARAGDSVWRISLGATQDLYDALDVPGDVDRTALPEAVLWGIAEARLEGLLKALERLTGQPVQIVAPDEEDPGRSCLLEFLMTGPEGGELRGFAHVPLEEDAVQAMERALKGRPAKGPDVGAVPVEVVVEAGRMALSAAELRGIGAGDVLLPEEWLPAAGCVHLSAPPLRVRVPWPDSGKGEWTIVNESESSMSEEKKDAVKPAEAEGKKDEGGKDEAAKPSPLASMGLGAVKIDVVFEIGRLRLTLDELRSLGEGRTLPLPEALGPQVPVTILGNGRKLGTGRVVNVGETLGVQITDLEGPKS